MTHMKTLFAKSVLVSLELAAAAADAVIHKKILRSGITKPIISKEKMRDLLQIVKSLEDFGLLIKSY